MHVQADNIRYNDNMAFNNFPLMSEPAASSRARSRLLAGYEPPRPLAQISNKRKLFFFSAAMQIFFSFELRLKKWYNRNINLPWLNLTELYKAN